MSLKIGRFEILNLSDSEERISKIENLSDIFECLKVWVLVFKIQTFNDQRTSNIFKAKFAESNDVKLFEDKRPDIINYSRYLR